MHIVVVPDEDRMRGCIVMITDMHEIDSLFHILFLFWFEFDENSFQCDVIAFNSITLHQIW